MAIKVQVKETGTNKVQSNLFNNGATLGMGGYDFVGVQPTMNASFGAWNTPASMSWNMPFAGMNAMTDLSAASAWNTPATFAASTLPYARQNAFMGQLPGMWQSESFVNPFTTTAAYAAPAMGFSPWMTGFNGQASSFNGLSGLNTPAVAAQSVSPMINTLGMNAMGANTLGMNAMGYNTPGNVALSQQAAITGQPVIAHLPIDVLDDGSQYLLVADLPGVKIDDLELTVENGILVIKGVAQSTTFVPGLSVTTPVATISREKAAVKIYQRAFAIGRDITVEDITASITNGVLTISLPKVNAITGTPSRIRNTVAAVA
ncbi:MAG: Hsp20/alpha crystallin family protein [Phycisphaerales bacterium]|nr:Hsp20/alpha crystallin family protein [Phycisphaerales bacterium]